MKALDLIAEALSLIKPGVQLGVNLFAIVARAKEIASSPTPATDDELAAFKKLIDDQKARLNANTAEIEKD